MERRARVPAARSNCKPEAAICHHSCRSCTSSDKKSVIHHLTMRQRVIVKKFKRESKGKYKKPKKKGHPENKIKSAKKKNLRKI